MRQLTAVRAFQLGAGLLLISGLAYGAVVKTQRVGDYFRAASGLWYILEHNIELPYLMSKSNSDIYPMYDLTVKARAGDWFPVAVGSGLGSASAVTNRYYRDVTTLNNPHSQLARSLYETGLLGTVLYVLAFVAPVVWATRRLPPKRQREFVVMATLLLGCSFADRSAAPFIYLGMFWSTFRLLDTVRTVPASPAAAAA